MEWRAKRCGNCMMRLYWGSLSDWKPISWMCASGEAPLELIVRC